MMLLFLLLTAVLVRVLVPLTEGTLFRTSAKAHALVEPADGENDDKENQCCCYKIRHAMNSTIVVTTAQVFRLKAEGSGIHLSLST
jgi:hypothetical protein